jgi:proteic killer suppression protein
MIRNFRDMEPGSLYHLQFVRRFSAIERQARRRLRVLDSAQTLHDLAGLPSKRFEALNGDCKGEYSIRIND